MYRQKKIGSIAAVKKLNNINIQVIKNCPIIFKTFRVIVQNKKNISTMTKVKPIAKSFCVMA